MMDKNIVWKWLILIALVAWSLVVVMPPEDKINLGLDLQGGYSFILEVDVSELPEDQRDDAQDRALEIIRNRIDQSGTKEPIIYPEPGDRRIVVQLPGLEESDRDSVVSVLTQRAHLSFRMVHEESEELTSDLFAQGLAPTGFEIVSAPLQHNRDRNRSYYRMTKEAKDGSFNNKEYRELLRRFSRPSPLWDFLLEKVDVNGQELFLPYYVSKKEEVTGDNLDNAQVEYGGQFNTPQVSIDFDKVGAKKFEITTKNYHPGGLKNTDVNNERQMAVILDDTVYSAPVLRVPIYNGSAVISGSFSPLEAQTLAIVMRAGALPADVNILTERVVAPTLGKESVESGVKAAGYGALAVVIFMFLYYRLGGLVVNAALILDAVLLPLGMMMAAGFLGLFANAGGAVGGNELPTLTLPGIAALVLTIGMAVDANVLIFERIREEQEAGKRFSSAIHSGYEKVFSTIFDANITTLLVAIILFWKGSGPIRGFAVTLSAGILVSMYTALVFTRMMFDFMARRTNIQELKMMTLVKDTTFNFLGKKKFAAIFSALLIIGTWFMFLQRGKDNFGVDFTGGRAITYRVDVASKPSEQAVRDVLNIDGVADVYVQFQKEITTGAELVEVKFGTGDLDKETQVKVDHQAKSGLDGLFNPEGKKDVMLQDESVGPQVGKELTWKGISAMLFAMLGIVVYISFRFEFAFAAGAIAALLHDVLITVGIYCLFGRQLSLPIIAALLTIVGYSVNDTIVVFDRIREDLKLHKGKPYTLIANRSINRTLGRTLLTSLTTLLTVVMLLVFGGGAINDFALALFIGIVVGTYSSVFVATPVMLLWHKDKRPGAST